MKGSGKKTGDENHKKYSLENNKKRIQNSLITIYTLMHKRTIFVKSLHLWKEIQNIETYTSER